MTAVQNQNEVPKPVVFLVDDEQEVRMTLSRALEIRGFTVTAFPSAETFLENYTSNQPGCLVLDYGMPGMNGLALQKEMTRLGISLPIIFISGHGGVPESVQAMKGGAMDFIPKPFRQGALVEAIRKAFEQDAATREKFALEFQTKTKFDRLTTREKEIADFILANPSATSSKHIGRELDISPRTVDHHRARILEKLEVSSVAELITLAGTIAHDTE
ncbi:MAG: response regulator [Pseudomonadota bacterium]